MKTSLRLVCGCIGATVSLAGPATAQALQTTLARASHDGSWAIEAVTERGECERLHRYYVVVTDNAVHLRSAFGETSPAPVGMMRKDGRVEATFGGADDPVSVKGQLGADSGGGRCRPPPAIARAAGTPANAAEPRFSGATGCAINKP